MINREDMLELTRRMTPARSHIDRIAGAYVCLAAHVSNGLKSRIRLVVGRI